MIIFVFLFVFVFVAWLCRTPRWGARHQRWLGWRTIPKVIHKVYIEHSMEIPQILPEIKEAHESWTQLNPGYVIKYYSGKDCVQYLKRHFGQSYADTFNNIHAYSGKANFFRYCVLYHEGGWYSDWKQVCLKPFHKWVKDKATFVGFYDIHWRTASDKSKNCGQPATMGSISGHPILREAIDIVRNNVKNRHYGRTQFDTTGPCVYGEAILKVLPTLNQDEYQLGRYIDRKMQMEGVDVIQHKCASCTQDQNWENGNNYAELWRQKNYYGERSPTPS